MERVRLNGWQAKLAVPNEQFASCRRMLLLLALMLLLSQLGNAQIRQSKKVLVVEDQISAPVVELVARDFESNLSSRSPDQIEFYRESLDTFLIPEGDYQSDVRKWYERKYSKRKLDLILTIGPASHEFIRTEHERFFPGVPVVFCLDIKPDTATDAADPNFTGVWTDFDPVSTLDAARHLLPTTKHVAVIAGSGLFDQAMTKSVRTKLEGYQGIDITYIVGVDIPSMLEKVHSLSQHTVVLYLTVTRDRGGHHKFVTYTLPLVSAASAAPVFGMIDLMAVRNAIVGGRVISLEDQGLLASEIALRVLQGAKPREHSCGHGSQPIRV